MIYKRIDEIILPIGGPIMEPSYSMGRLIRPPRPTSSPSKQAETYEEESESMTIHPADAIGLAREDSTEWVAYIDQRSSIITRLLRVAGRLRDMESYMDEQDFLPTIEHWEFCSKPRLEGHIFYIMERKQKPSRGEQKGERTICRPRTTPKSPSRFASRESWPWKNTTRTGGTELIQRRRRSSPDKRPNQRNHDGQSATYDQ